MVFLSSLQQLGQRAGVQHIALLQQPAPCLSDSVEADWRSPWVLWASLLMATGTPSSSPAAVGCRAGRGRSGWALSFEEAAAAERHDATILSIVDVVRLATVRSAGRSVGRGW